MEKTKKTFYIILIGLLLVIGTIAIILMNKNKENNDFNAKTYYASKNEYIKILDKENYELIRNNETKIKGKYEENDKEIKFEELTIAYKKGDYLLLKDSNLDSYVMYYDDSKYDSFLNNIKSSNIYEYMTQDFSSELKEQIIKIEINKVNECFKSTLDEENFTCSVDYSYYIKDYKPEKCSEYESQELYMNIFAGSAPICEKDYISKWNLLRFEKSKDTYKITNSFTAL